MCRSISTMWFFSLGAIMKIKNHPGDLDEALRIREQLLEIREATLGSEHPDTLKAMVGLATTLLALLRLGEARQLEEKVLEIRIRNLGSEHPDTLSSMNNLAVTLKLLGDLDGARRMGEQVLATRERLNGAKDPGTTLSAWNLLSTVRKLGDGEAEAELIGKLRWLLDYDHDEIASVDQQSIRGMLLARLRHA